MEVLDDGASEATGVMKMGGDADSSDDNTSATDL